MGQQTPERRDIVTAKTFNQCLEEIEKRELKQAIADWRKSPLKPAQAPKPQRKQRVQRVEPGAGSYRHPANLDYP